MGQQSASREQRAAVDSIFFPAAGDTETAAEDAGIAARGIAGREGGDGILVQRH
jgi:hypothetical protein